MEFEDFDVLEDNQGLRIWKAANSKRVADLEQILKNPNGRFYNTSGRTK